MLAEALPTAAREARSERAQPRPTDWSRPGDLPVPSCSLTTELLRLRGGPYWTISYAWLRATPWARSVRYDQRDADDEPKKFCVDHDTDGGGCVPCQPGSSRVGCEQGEVGSEHADALAEATARKTCTNRGCRVRL